MIRLALVFFAALVSTVAVAVVADRGEGGKPPSLVVEAKGNSSLAAAKRFPDFALLHAGEAFEGLPLVAVDRQLGERQPGEPVRRNTVSFVYGSCELEAGDDGLYDGGCAPPLSIEVWPACERHPGLYPFEPDERLRVRGADAAFYEGHRRLEVFTGEVTVVLFGQEREQLLRAARQLRGVNVALEAGAPLSGASPAARAGTACG